MSPAGQESHFSRNFFFPVPQPNPDLSQNPAPAKVPFPLLKRVALRSKKEGALGKKIAWGGWGGQGEKKKKDALKKK